jgi:hypothetical protein
MRERIEHNKQSSFPLVLLLLPAKQWKGFPKKSDVVGKGKHDERPKQPIKPLDNNKKGREC